MNKKIIWLLSLLGERSANGPGHQQEALVEPRVKLSRKKNDIKKIDTLSRKARRLLREHDYVVSSAAKKSLPIAKVWQQSTTSNSDSEAVELAATCARRRVR